MENFECKLCFKTFSNGKALGGHMRSHLMNHKGEETESSSFSSSSSQDDGERGGGGEGGTEENKNYELRENPKRSIHFIDGGGGGCSLVLQDRESETESSYSKNPTRKRSKRRRRTLCDSWFDSQEPVLSPSVSDTTTEEDVAYCLMLLSRDNKKEKQLQEDQDRDQDIELSDEDDESYNTSNKISKGRYKCETCSRVFKSYQALGGHRASHKKGVRVINESSEKQGFEGENVNVSLSGTATKKIHECSYCFRVFSSGQALGGHKRSHTVMVPPPKKNSPKFRENSSLIDLNLPPTAVDDEVSAVSDAEFVFSGHP